MGEFSRRALRWWERNVSGRVDEEEEEEKEEVEVEEEEEEEGFCNGGRETFLGRWALICFGWLKKCVRKKSCET